MYDEFYGFSQPPFNLTPDPKFLYLTPTHSEAYSAMLSGIRARNGITVITGEPGTGKTTLIQTLLSDLEQNVRTAFIFFTSLGFKDLMKSILYELEIPLKGEDATGLLEKFYVYLSERPEDETVAIIIDEAQGLQTTVLRELVRLWASPVPGSKVLQTILVGQPELAAKLGSAELKELRKRIAAQCHIRPLTLKESKAYIDHRLKIVGSSSSRVLKPEVIDRICDYAKGIPRTINMVCDAALLIGYAKSKHEIDARIINEAVADLSFSEPVQSTEVLPDVIQIKESAPAKRVQEPAKGLAEPLSEPVQTQRPRRVKPLHGILAGLMLAMVLMGLFALKTWERAAQKETAAPPSVSERAPREETATANPVSESTPQREAGFTRPIQQEAANQKGAATLIAERGSTLYVLAKKHYGTANPTLIDLILQANPRITDVNFIKVNQKIEMPRISEESLLIRCPDNTYKIHLGTFLRKPATRSLENQPTLQGKAIEVVSRPVSPRETWYRVMAGRFETREEGIKTLQTIRSKGIIPALSASRE